MEFWGVEIKGSEPLIVKGADDFVVHLSQASLGEGKKDKETEAVLTVKIDGKKFVIGTLSPLRFPQMSLDLVFGNDFELSHSWKNGTVYLTGYKVPMESREDDSVSDSDEELPISANNVRPRVPAQQVEPPRRKADDSNSSKGKKKVNIVEPNKDVKSTDDSSDEYEDDSDDDQGMLQHGEDEVSGDDEDDESDEEDGESEDDESDDDDNESSDEENDRPMVGELGKKRAAVNAVKTPVPDKKAKFVTPQKPTVGKKVTGHTATPHPSKHTAKMPANNGQKQGQNQKGIVCKACSRSFGSDTALQAHTKAKHNAA